MVGRVTFLRFVVAAPRGECEEYRTVVAGRSTAGNCSLALCIAGNEEEGEEEGRDIDRIIARDISTTQRSTSVGEIHGLCG